jgi:hypothetical protein
MITKINTNFPENTNKKIINKLYNNSNWKFGLDFGRADHNINKPDAGFLVSTYSKSSPYTEDLILNSYMNVIFDLINKKSILKFTEITRVYWNWYNSNSQTCFHPDSFEDSQYSIIYNLHNSDGGTEFKIEDKTIFYPSIESEALIFPSKIYHRGIAAKKNINRFALNILTQIQ